MKYRNSVSYVLGMLAGGLGSVAAHESWLPDFLLAYKDWIEFAAVCIGGASAAARQSFLPHSESADQTIDLKRLVVDPPNR